MMMMILSTTLMLMVLLVMTAAAAAVAAEAASTTITNTVPAYYTIAGEYKTNSDFARTASLIDLDQKQILDYLKDDESFEYAKAIYEKGMYSGSYAKLTLKNPISSQDANEIVSVTHTHDDGILLNAIGSSSSTIAGSDGSTRTIVYGTVTLPPPSAYVDGGISHLLVHYEKTNNMCRVGGNPKPQMDQCLVGPEGGLILQGYNGGNSIDYTYDPLQDNKFTSSLMGFSEDEAHTMSLCKEKCPYVEYEHYYKYYGQLDYGHHWIDSAFHKQATDYNPADKLEHGNVDFSLYRNPSAIGIAISTATITLNVFTQINRLMVEKAVGACKAHSRDFSTYGNSKVQHDYVEAWDIAVATYAGSMLIDDDDDDDLSANSKNKKNINNEQYEYGTLYYSLVEEMAKEFGVLHNSYKSNTGRSIVNSKIMEEFNLGRNALLQDDCDIASNSYYRIIILMRIPLLQGILRSAYELQKNASDDNDENENIERERGSAHAYLAALLPDLTSCSKESAQIIYDEFNHVRPSYKIVHDELYNNLECLRIVCTDIGGYINANTGDYYKQTYPLCGGNAGNGVYDATSTIGNGSDGSEIERRSSTGSSTGSGSSSSERFNNKTTGNKHNVFIVAVVVCGCIIAAAAAAAYGGTTRRNNNYHYSSGIAGGSSSSSSRSRGLLSSVSSQADYWLSRRSSFGNSIGSSNRTSSSSNGFGGGSFAIELGNSSFSSINSNNSNINNNDNDNDNSSSSSNMSLELPLQEITRSVI